MPLLRRPPSFELINVHRVQAEKEIMLFLKNAEKDFVEGLFYTAKKYGKSSFQYKGDTYDILRNRDASFNIVYSENQNLTPESLS